MNRLFAILIPLLGLINHSFVSCATQRTNGRIINGQNSELVPHAARITGFSLEYSTVGGASFISYSHLVTAASVMYNMSIFYIYFGSTNMGNIASRSATGFTHPDYDPYTFENDIGLIVLGSPIDESAATPIPLPRILNTPLVNEQGRVSGFGLIDRGNGWVLNFDKQTGYFRVLEDEKCKELLGERQELKASSHFCTENEKQMCYGDHGSGIIVNNGEEDFLVGIVSVITNMCHGSYPVMFTQVSKYIDWIKENINGE